jgi:hypothetical protein
VLQEIGIDVTDAPKRKANGSDDFVASEPKRKKMHEAAGNSHYPFILATFVYILIYVPSYFLLFSVELGQPGNLINYGLTSNKLPLKLS